jgi:hypothetical protein
MNVAPFIVFSGGFYCLIQGVRYRKVLNDKKIGILYLIMAACALVAGLSMSLVQVYPVTKAESRIALVIQGFVIGIWFGIFLTMRILGVLRAPKKGSVPEGVSPKH